MQLGALTVLKLWLSIVVVVFVSLVILLVTGFIPREATLLILAAWIVFLAVMIAIGVRSGRLSFYCHYTTKRRD